MSLQQQLHSSSRWSGLAPSARALMQPHAQQTSQQASPRSIATKHSLESADKATLLFQPCHHLLPDHRCASVQRCTP